MNNFIPYEDEPFITLPIMDLRAPGNKVAPWDRKAHGGAGQGFGGLQNLLAGQGQANQQRLSDLQDMSARQQNAVRAPTGWPFGGII